MQLSSNLALNEVTRHVLFHHHQTSGWVTLANKEKSGRQKIINKPMKRPERKVILVQAII
jgi:hypothetical protein